MDSVLLNIYSKGKYYNPAWSHYGRHTNVVCDRCKSSQLKVCIGWEKYDLCMKCVDQLSKYNGTQIESDYDGTRITMMEQRIFRDNRNQPLTRMSQGMFNIGSNLIDDNEMKDNNYNNYNNRNGIITKMMQDMFKNKTEK
jgi:hypothetical protein